MEAPLGIMQTVPVVAPWAGAELTAANNTVPISMRIDAEAKLIFFKNYTRICGLIKKTVRLRFSAFPSFTSLLSVPSIPMVHCDVLKTAQTFPLVRVAVVLQGDPIDELVLR